MEKRFLLSIAIPTWNRASSLENLLNNIFGQMRGLEGEVEVCISNNGSADRTREVVMNFKNRYPNLIQYHENEKNLGFDINLLGVIEMASGRFIWTFGDDDFIKEGGLGEVIALIKKSSVEKTGLIFVRREQYFINKQTGQKVICANTVDAKRSEIFTMEKKDVIGMDSPDPGFMTALILNGKITKDILYEENVIVKKSIGINFLQVLLHSIMFLKYQHLNAISLNKVIVLQELPVYKYFIEDNFKMDYQLQKKLNNLLLSYPYTNDTYAPIFIKSNKRLRKKFVVTMIKMRALESFNYHSYVGCLKIFFEHAPILDALIFSFTFFVLSWIPSKLLQPAYKIFLMAKYGKMWQSQWILAYQTTKGLRRWEFDSR